MASTDFASVGAAVSAGKPLIVDVRTEDEFAAGRIPGAVNIPLSEVLFLSCKMNDASDDALHHLMMHCII